MGEHWLTKEMDRRKALIYILLFSNYEISLTRLVTLLRVDQKTVENDLHFIANNWSEVVLINKTSTTVTLVELPMGHVQDIFLDMIHESIYMNVLEAILLKKCTSIQELATTFYLSISTIRRILKQINSNLATKGISLKQQTLKLESENKTVLSMFCFYFFLEKNEGLAWPFSSIAPDKLFGIVDRSAQLFELAISKRFRFIIAYFMAVILETGDLLIIPDKPDRCFIKSIDMEITKYLLDGFRSDLSDTQLNKLKYLLQSILSKMNEFIHSPSNRKLGQELVKKLSIDLGITIDKKSMDKLMYIFAYNSFLNEVYPYNHFLVFDKEYFDSYSLKYYFPKFSLALEKELKWLEKQTGTPWFTRYYTNCLHDLFIIWKDLPKKIHAIRKKVSISIITRLDDDYLNAIEYFVLEEVKCQCKIILRKANFSNEDYVISATELEKSQIIITNLQLKQYTENQFIVNDIPDKQQLKVLKKMILDLWISS